MVTTVKTSNLTTCMKLLPSTYFNISMILSYIQDSNLSGYKEVYNMGKRGGGGKQMSNFTISTSDGKHQMQSVLLTPHECAKKAI
jgi:hypothetical protein